MFRWEEWRLGKGSGRERKDVTPFLWGKRREERVRINMYIWSYSFIIFVNIFPENLWLIQRKIASYAIMMNRCPLPKHTCKDLDIFFVFTFLFIYLCILSLAVKPLYYGSYSSFCPSYDSTFANLTKEESEMVYATYGNETAVQYAERYAYSCHTLFV